MSHIRDEWVTVVESEPLGRGQAAYANWLSTHGLDAKALKPDDVRVDVIRTSQGTRMRYRVRKEALGRVLASETETRAQPPTP